MTRIAIASDDEHQLARHTGRCRGFVIFDIVDGVAARVGYRPNDFTGHARGECHEHHAHAAGQGHHSHDGLINALQDCCALLTRGMGPRLVNDLAAVGIEAFVCDATEVEGAAEAFARGDLAHGESAPCPHWAR
jgi:predicted Fe-Mo cluster-binding NifX family protein